MENKVLVPFDIGVVYINLTYNDGSKFSFSPLRYWGGLYHKLMGESHIQNVLVPFDVRVVYTTRCSWNNGTFKF